MTTNEGKSPQAEHENHRYIGHEIPWYIHVMWLTFWIFAIGYVLIYLFPAIRSELVSPP